MRLLKEFHYARSNAGPDLRAGKLVTSKRTNWVDPIIPLFGGEGSIPIAITQSYRYEGRDGRISARQTRATVGVGHYAFLTEFEWSRQGNLEVLRYPRCLHAGCVATGLDEVAKRGVIAVTVEPVGGRHQGVGRHCKKGAGQTVCAELAMESDTRVRNLQWIRHLEGPRRPSAVRLDPRGGGPREQTISTAASQVLEARS